MRQPRAVHRRWGKKITGAPDPAHISTSNVERQNLTMRMGMRRFTRLTNPFSRKAENLAAAVSLHFMYYNFSRPHLSRLFYLRQFSTYPLVIKDG